MGKPRLMIIIRHGLSEGNNNKTIHQFTADHKVKLTPEGWTQAQDAGQKLKAMLNKDDTIRIYTSPYRRTRETTEGILSTLTAADAMGTSSPFQRDQIRVLEEPRLREQDFGNFQPCSAEMERIWQERADYGHFFYRIPSGESAADCYDRVSSFNESLWRQFDQDDFPSVCVFVTHGLMSRVFLMKWYRWTVEYFEDLRNTHHCDLLIMEKNELHRYTLKQKMRTWSELRNKKPNVFEHIFSVDDAKPVKWGGCPAGCNHQNVKDIIPRVKRNATASAKSLDSRVCVSSPLCSQDKESATATATTQEAGIPCSHQTENPPDSPLDLTVAAMMPPRLIARKSTMKFDASHLLHDHEKSTSYQGKRNPKAVIATTTTTRTTATITNTVLEGRQPADDDSSSKSSSSESENEYHQQLLSLPPYRRKASFARWTGRDGGGSQSGMPSPISWKDETDPEENDDINNNKEEEEGEVDDDADDEKEEEAGHLDGALPFRPRHTAPEGTARGDIY